MTSPPSCPSSGFPGVRAHGALRNPKENDMYDQRADYAVRTFEAVAEKLKVHFGGDAKEKALELTSSLLVADAIQNTMSDIGPLISDAIKDVAQEIGSK
jgi:hypothetical protein